MSIPRHPHNRLPRAIRSGDPYQLGAASFVAGVALDGNPFDEKFPEHRELWEAGWSEAEREGLTVDDVRSGARSAEVVESGVKFRWATKPRI